MKPVRLPRSIAGVVVAVLAAAYPFALETGLDHLSARIIGVAVLAITVLLVLTSHGHASRIVPLLVRRFGLIMVAAGAAAATNHPAALLLLPSVTSLWLLATFARTLRSGPPLVAQFASAVHGGLPDFLLPYCRKVTWMWCIFFAANAVVSGVLAFAASQETWAFYNGFAAYLVVALLGTGEYVLHKSRFRFYEDGWVDSIWRKLCPPERTEIGRRILEWQAARATEAQ